MRFLLLLFDICLHVCTTQYVDIKYILYTMTPTRCIYQTSDVSYALIG